MSLAKAADDKTKLAAINAARLANNFMENPHKVQSH
jgi:hypothetical protein